MIEVLPHLSYIIYFEMFIVRIVLKRQLCLRMYIIVTFIVLFLILQKSSMKFMSIVDKFGKLLH